MSEGNSNNADELHPTNKARREGKSSLASDGGSMTAHKLSFKIRALIKSPSDNELSVFRAHSTSNPFELSKGWTNPISQVYDIWPELEDERAGRMIG
jgi:hypothetical protein